MGEDFSGTAALFFYTLLSQDMYIWGDIFVKKKTKKICCFVTVLEKPSLCQYNTTVPYLNSCQPVTSSNHSLAVIMNKESLHLTHSVKHCSFKVKIWVFLFNTMIPSQYSIQQVPVDLPKYHHFITVSSCEVCSMTHCKGVKLLKNATRYKVCLDCYATHQLMLA